MSKVISAAIAAALAFGSAAAVAKTYDLTQQERMEMRERADRLVADRARDSAATHKQEVTMPRAVSGKQELTQDERMELRNRAARLVAERDQHRR